ncbi:MAG TPA: Mut7-C RNAse domain-containing protein [Salinisphaeraceae bacterium]|nr:Mut7-C RNAse domain-containing protein [Salinisphaeraceae bacterium]
MLAPPVQPGSTFLFHGELNDFLAPARRDTSFEFVLERRASIKDIIEALGPPHTEVGAIQVTGQAVDFNHIPVPGARIEAWPNPRGHASALRPPLPWPPAFVLDTHLGRLTRYLRLLGFDSRYSNDRGDAELAAIADRERRLLLTRDRGLLKRARVTFARFVRADDPRMQLEDVFLHFRLRPAMQPFSRCARCNGMLQDVSKGEIAHRLAPKTRRYYQHFRQCTRCGRLFWQGSHLDALRRMLERLPS